MKKIVVLELGLIEDYLKSGKTYEYFESYYNPGDYFDEIYCLSTGGENIKIGKVQYINAQPIEYGEIISRIKPDIVRVYAGFGPCDWAVANRVKDIPIAVSVHDTNPNLLNRSLRYADYIICMSEAVKKTVRHYISSFDEDKIYVMPNRVDTQIFYKKSDINISENLDERYGMGKHILHVGRKVEQKNLETLIKALQYLPLEYKAIFVGPGDAAVYERLAIECNVEERCYFVDCVDKNNLPDYFSWCDCMCTPSRWEGFGMVFIEAAACECAIITSDIAPMNEYLTDGMDCLLVKEYENPEILANYIVMACEKNEKMEMIKRNAGRTGLKFDKKLVDKQEVELYKKFIAHGADNAILYEIEKERERTKKKIIIFGAGKVGRRLLNHVGKEEVAYFVDNDHSKTGSYIDGIETINYAELLKIHEEYTIVVTPINRKEIVEKLMSDGVNYMEERWYMLLRDQVNRTGKMNGGKAGDE